MRGVRPRAPRDVEGADESVCHPRNIVTYLLLLSQIVGFLDAFGIGGTTTYCLRQWRTVRKQNPYVIPSVIVIHSVVAIHSVVVIPDLIGNPGSLFLYW